jgi:phage FluMu gp28-like protein
MKSLSLRPYQVPIFQDNTSGVLVLHWARQIGKSYVLAAWAIWRMMSRPGRLVTVLSNSRENGIEFAQKCQEILALAGAAFEQSQSLDLEILITEIRLKVQGRISRVKILAANPRTARGFSGDVILDEFAHQQDDAAIWEAIEPVLASNKDFLCRIAGTGNGRRGKFYEFVTGGQFPVSRVSRTDAWRQGTKVYHPVTRAEVTPTEARAAAADKIAYDQNYELAFTGGGAPLLTADAILKAEEADCGEIIDGEPSGLALVRLSSQDHMKFVGIDIGRTKDLTVATVLELIEKKLYTRAIVRLASMPFREQTRILSMLLETLGQKLTGGCLDMTGVGLGLAEELSERFPGRLTGVHFSQNVTWADAEVRITDAMSVNLLGLFEDERIKIPAEAALRASLQLPERSGRASGILYTPRSAAGHADDFWSLALGAWSARAYEVPFQYLCFEPRARQRKTGL